MTSDKLSGDNGDKSNGIFQLFSSPKQDLLASIVVFLVALPLCIGIAIASGVPVAAGLITGIVGGLIVGWIAGAPLQVSGPAAGLTVIVFELVQNHGLEVMGIAVLIGGTIQLVAGLLGYGRWFRAVSPAVIHGMLAGIGVLILSSQFHVMVDDTPKANCIQNIVSIPDAIIKGLPLPEMGTPELRTSQRDLLQQFGALHEQQVQIREWAAEMIPKTIDNIDHGHDAHHPETRVFPNKAQLENLAVMQKDLSAKLKTLIKKMNSQGVNESVRNPEKLKVATVKSVKEMEVALNHLQQGEAKLVNRSQSDIQHRLEQVLGELKNHDWAAKVGWMTIFVLVFWKILSPKKLKLIPASLVAVVVATIFATSLQLPVLYVEVPDNLWSEVHFPSLTVLQSTPRMMVVIRAGIVIAVVASAATLLCATAVDQMQSEFRTDYNKELTAQGIGNIICGLLGALPMTGVIVRSSANIEAGGKTRLSTILHGAWLVIFVAILSFILRMMPTSALAGILVYIGYKLVNINVIKDLNKFGWGEVVIYFATLITIISIDLLTGVITGMVLSAAKLLYKFSHLKIHSEIDEDGHKTVLKMTGAATFIRLPDLAEALECVPDNSELHVDFEHLTHIDHACLDLLMNWAKQHEATGGTLIIDWDSLHADFHNKPYRKLQAQKESTH